MTKQEQTEKRNEFHQGYYKGCKDAAKNILKEIRGYYPIDKDHCDNSELFILELCYELANKYGVELEK